MSRSAFFDTLAGVLGGAPFARPYWRAVLVGLLCVVTWLALMPKPPPELSTGWDKMNHALAFATLAVVAVLGLVATHARIACALLAYGGCIEVLQSFTPHRQAEWADLFVDGLGIALGLALGAIALRTARARAASA